MIMICWFYCLSFVKLLYFASGPLLFLFSLFVLKRGIRLSRVGLRQTSFLLMFFSVVKVCAFDLRMLKGKILCAADPFISFLPCNRTGFIVLEMLGLLLLIVASFVILHFYRAYLPNMKFKQLRPEDVGLRFWANLSLFFVFAMIVWTLAPWVGSLTVGYVPKIFITLQWQHFAIANLLLLLVGFWKVESCNWQFDPKEKKENRSMQAAQSWTPRDTLWLNVFLYLITLALSYVAHDVLTGSMRR